MGDPKLNTANTKYMWLRTDHRYNVDYFTCDNKKKSLITMHCLFLVIMECISSPSRRKLNYQNMLYNINSTWYEICNFAIVVTNLSSRTSILECSTMFSEIEILIYLLHSYHWNTMTEYWRQGIHQDRLVSIFYFYFLGRGGKKSCLVTNYIKIKIL